MSAGSTHCICCENDLYFKKNIKKTVVCLVFGFVFNPIFNDVEAISMGLLSSF